MSRAPDPLPLLTAPELCVELLSGFSSLIEAELHLAQGKILQRLGITASQILLGLGVFCVALLGAGAVLASLILGLGKLMGDRYWLSALVAGLSLLLIGLPLTLKSFSRSSLTSRHQQGANE